LPRDHVLVRLGLRALARLFGERALARLFGGRR
jgi:hypothetical protein